MNVMGWLEAIRIGIVILDALDKQDKELIPRVVVPAIVDGIDKDHEATTEEIDELRHGIGGILKRFVK